MEKADDPTFRIIFTGDGAGKLRDRVKEKLKEFMGDYTDDTLVEYVIVLLKNGRRKEEARNELNVFLGDDSDSFVSWLWDHLRSNINVYAQPRESRPDAAAKQKPKPVEADGKADPHLVSEPEREKSNKPSKSRRSKDWRGVIRAPDEPPPIRSAVIANIHEEDGKHQSVGEAKRSPSPRPVIQRKRGRSDERSHVKRETVPKSTLGASRRLLQFAVRDAVATSRPSGLASEPSLKRLRSVVSTPTEETQVEVQHPKIRSVARVPSAMAVAIKAVADAAKDVVKVKPSGNVFDRLGRGADVSDTTDHFTEYRKAAVEDDGEYEGLSQIPEAKLPTYHERRGYSGQYVEDISMLESEDGFASDFAYGNEKYSNATALDHGVNMDVSDTRVLGGNVANDSMMFHRSVANVANENAHITRKDQDIPPPIANSSSKVVNISSNVNTWKQPHYQEPRGFSDKDNQKFVHQTELGASKSNVRPMKENNNLVTVSNGNGNKVSALDAQGESQKVPLSTGLYPTGRPVEDADSRTIFISNVHFAATKDSLSRHFNKFGEVLKVVIVTDAATAQPKGSAYVEFMRKEAAENALSLDGTSFMSRILKVVRKSSAHQDTVPTVTWPRVTRASPFAAARFSRAPFARGIPSLYRSRLQIRPGARSLQWKRDAQNSPSETTTSSAATPSPTTRSLTYVRPETKADGDSNTT